jgi:hypothetical protein
MSPAILEPSGLRPRDTGTGTRRVTLYKYLKIVTKQWIHRFVAAALILSSLLIVCCIIRLVLGHSVSVVPQGLYLVSLTAALMFGVTFGAILNHFSFKVDAFSSSSCLCFCLQYPYWSLDTSFKRFSSLFLRQSIADSTITS